MKTRWLENWAFSFYPCREKKTDGTRQTDGLDDASTDFVQHRFCGLKEGNLNIFCVFQLETEGG